MGLKGKVDQGLYIDPKDKETAEDTVLLLVNKLLIRYISNEPLVELLQVKEPSMF